MKRLIMTAAALVLLITHAAAQRQIHQVTEYDFVLTMVVVTPDGKGGVIACEILNLDALSALQPGRVYDLTNPDRCNTGFAPGTRVVLKKNFHSASCVVPEGASTPCVWMMTGALREKSYPAPYAYMKPVW